MQMRNATARSLSCCMTVQSSFLPLGAVLVKDGNVQSGLLISTFIPVALAMAVNIKVSACHSPGNDAEQ